jgi:formamidopyrimidine-DNA glycosylase
VAGFGRSLVGRRLIDASRRGKYLIVTLDNGRLLILHFGMGGDLFYLANKDSEPDYTRILFELDEGKLAFTCPRKICRVMSVKSVDEVPALKEMGPEPLESSWSLLQFEAVLERSPRSQIKPLLMDQRRVAGVGNIYADQILFEAGVRPDRRASTLSEKEIKQIYSETKRVLRTAIKTANEEEFPPGFLAARRQRGVSCGRCGSNIDKKTIGGRTAHYCIGCQS